MLESDPDHVFVRLMTECEGYGLLGIGIDIRLGIEISLGIQIQLTRCVVGP